MLYQCRGLWTLSMWQPLKPQVITQQLQLKLFTITFVPNPHDKQKTHISIYRQDMICLLWVFWEFKSWAYVPPQFLPCSVHRSATRTLIQYPAVTVSMIHWENIWKFQYFPIESLTYRILTFTIHLYLLEVSIKISENMNKCSLKTK